MPITYRAFVDGLEALTVSGVTKSFTKGPPQSLNTGQLPAMWVQAPGGNERAFVFGQSGESPTYTAIVMVAVEAVGQNTTPVNYDATVDMMDNLSAALQSSTAHALATGSPTWQIQMVVITVAGLDYWAVMATVEVLA